MGLFEKLQGKEGESQNSGQEGKYKQQCSLCNKPESDKKWLGQYWHKKCLRQMKKASRKML